MGSEYTQQLTEILQAWSAGDRSAAAKIAQIAYPELRKIARRCFSRERGQQTIQPTALVNEAYLRLVNLKKIQWNDRAHFYAVCARFMRRILVDYARKRPRKFQIQVDPDALPGTELSSEILALDSALEGLAKFDSRKAQVVELRFFGGLTAEEIASHLGISVQSVHRDWGLAKSWLLRTMRSCGSATMGED